LVGVGALLVFFSTNTIIQQVLVSTSGRNGLLFNLWKKRNLQEDYRIRAPYIASFIIFATAGIKLMDIDTLHFFVRSQQYL
jgi:hypothetical protein